MFDSGNRRWLLIGFFCITTVAGMMIVNVADKSSDLFVVGGILGILGVLPLMYFVFYTARKRAPVRPAVRDFSGPFAPQLRADIAHESGCPLEDGDYRAVFVLGTDGFTARFRVLPGGPAEVEFLVPQTALIRFPSGTEFRVAQGKEIVGKGKVL